MQGDETRKDRTLDEPGNRTRGDPMSRGDGGHGERSGDEEWRQPRLGMRPVAESGRAFAWCRFKTCCPGGWPR